MQTDPTPRATNPVVRQTPLCTYPGWTVREYADGMFDASHHTGVGLTLGVTSLGAAIVEVHEMEKAVAA